MSNFALLHRFKQLESLPVPDPWGMGIVFHVRPVSYKPFMQWAGAIAESMVSPEDRKLRDFLRFLPGDVAGKEILAALNGRDYSKRPEVDRARNIEGTLMLLAGWDGVTDEDGEAVAFSEEAVREMLSLETPIGEPIKVEVEGSKEPVMLASGQTMAGEAIQAWILHHARKLELYRQEQVAEGGKGSGRPSRPRTSKARAQ